jgi:arylsulfatase A-like enzyme
MATAMDLFPTLVELAGARNPEGRLIDGRNIMNMLEGKQESPHSQVYCFLGKSLAAVRSGPWKLHLFRSKLQLNGLRKPVPCNPPELYHLDDDPSEQRNVAGANPALVKQLSAQAHQLEITIEPAQLLPPWRGPF